MEYHQGKKGVEYIGTLTPRGNFFPQYKEHIFWDQCPLCFYGKMDGNFQADILMVKEIRTDIHMITTEDSHKIARLQS